VNSGSDTPELYFLRIFKDNFEEYQTEGMPFLTREEAWLEASRAAGEIIKDMAGAMHPFTDWRMDVTNEAGSLVCRLSFKTEQF
jgi:hypothetical protein